MSGKRAKEQRRQQQAAASRELTSPTLAARPAPKASAPKPEYAPDKLATLPDTYQALNDYFATFDEVNPFPLRLEAMRRIEAQTGRPLVCYVAKTHHVVQGAPAYVDDSDLSGFADLTRTTSGSELDVFLVSNGGSPEATERIVRLIRDRFSSVRFLVPGNAYSAATLMCFAGEAILMDSIGTLGPIDPQLNGVPARAILRAFEAVEARLKAEGPSALTAYVPLLAKYDLHLFELCKSGQQLSEELARNWLSKYMLGVPEEDPKVARVVEFFASFDTHKSHGRSIDRTMAREIGLPVSNMESVPGLEGLVRSLYHQYEFWFDSTPFVKMFENARGINWGRQAQSITFQIPVGAPGTPAPQPGPPQRSN